MMKKFLILATLPFVFGCGSDDPLANQPEYIRKATPGFQKPQEPIASEETMLISSNQTEFLFTEGVEGQVALTGRVLLDNYKSNLQIDNLADFDGATFDPETGIFTWTPPKNYVTGADSSRRTLLRVRMNAFQASRGVTATRTKDFPVTVARQEKQPTITSESGFPRGPVREGDTLRITLVVDDPDAVNQPGLKPRIFLQGPANKPRIGDLTPYIRVASENDPERDFSNPSLWKFTLNVALTDVDMTKNSGDFAFRATAVSRYGKISATKEYRISVLTNLLQPLLTSDSFEVKSGVALVQDVLIFDPRQEGRVEVEILDPRDIPTGFEIKCAPQPNRVWMNVCRASWAVPATSPNAPTPLPNVDPRTEAVVRVRAYNHSTVISDNYSVFKDYSLKFKVVP